MYEIEHLTEVRAALKLMKFKIPDADTHARTIREGIDEDIENSAIESRLKSLKGEVEEFPEEARARMLVSKWMTLDIANAALAVSGLALDDRDPDFFAAWFDTYTTISNFAGHMSLPNIELNSERTLDSFEYAVEAVHGGNTSISNKADTFLLINGLQTAGRALLVENEKGFVLADEIAKMMRGEKNRFYPRDYVSICDPIIEGGIAMYSAGLYKRKYPVAEAVLSQK